MSFRWNDSKEHVYWDPMFNSESADFRSDKRLLQNPSSARTEDVMLALCRVAVELMELAEKNKELAEAGTKLARVAQERELSRQLKGMGVGPNELLTTCKRCQKPRRAHAHYCDHCGG